MSDATNKYYATWAMGWGIGDTPEDAIKTALSNNPQLAKKIINAEGSLTMWICLCLEDFTEIEYFMPQCKIDKSRNIAVVKFTKDKVHFVTLSEKRYD